MAKVFVYSVLALGALWTGNSVMADWCSGTWMPFVDMKLSDRVGRASAALHQIQKELQETATRMKLDVEANRTRLMQQIQLEKQRLYGDTRNLCISSQDAVFPLQYGMVSLQNVNQLHAQLRLNLGLYYAQDKVGQELQEQISSQQSLTTAISAKYNELVVLEQQAHFLQGLNGVVPDAERFVQTACLAVQTGANLLDTVPTTSLEAMLSEVLRQEQQPVKMTEVEKLLADCSVLPKPISSAAQVDQPNWFNRLF